MRMSKAKMRKFLRKIEQKLAVSKVWVVYLSYPYSADPEKYTKEIKKIAREIMANNKDLILLIPHYVFDAVFDFQSGYGSTQRHIGFLELALISRCDIFAYDPDKTSAGVIWEMCFAKLVKIPIMTMEELENGKRPE